MFPAGGPVPPELVIGRRGEIRELHGRLRERVGTLLSGPRRIGKTTVCDAACAEAARDFDALVVKVEVPERKDGSTIDLLESVISASTAAAPDRTTRWALREARPVVEELLKEVGLPLDLSHLGRDPDANTLRQVVALPLELARRTERRTVFYLDELQRITDYADGETFVLDLVDIYTNNSMNELVTVLVDGSDERALTLLDRQYGLGKLCLDFPLGETIPRSEWQVGLPDHFGRVGLEIDLDALDQLIAFGAGRPYVTMLTAQRSAMNARELKSDRVDEPTMAFAITETQRELGE